MNTQENNKLIAEFMGYNLNNLTPSFLNNLKYHTSWDWLMPVLKKINLKLHPDTYGFWRMITHPVEYNIENVHNQVVEFINQHNK